MSLALLQCSPGTLPLSTHQKIESETFDGNVTPELGRWNFLTDPELLSDELQEAISTPQ